MLFGVSGLLLLLLLLLRGHASNRLSVVLNFNLIKYGIPYNMVNLNFGVTTVVYGLPAYGIRFPSLL